jgi:hypothetical protein
MHLGEQGVSRIPGTIIRPKGATITKPRATPWVYGQVCSQALKGRHRAFDEYPLCRPFRA